MQQADFPVQSDGTPVITECVAEDCTETEDLMVQECAPNHSWMFTGGKCGHWGFIYRELER